MSQVTILVAEDFAGFREFIARELQRRSKFRVQDQRIRERCKTIVAGQQQEVDQMRAILADLHRDG